MGSRIMKILIVLAAVALMAALSVAVYAYLSTASGSVENKFSVATESDPSINETFTNGIIKESVSVNVGQTGYSVYVRVAIVVTWRNNNNVYAQKPVEGTDYSISLKTGDNDFWFAGEDGFYYHKSPVESGDNTKDLIESCRQLTAAPAGYSLHVEIIAQTIQAAGTTDPDGNGNSVPAVTDAWGVTVTDGNLTKD